MPVSQSDGVAANWLLKALPPEDYQRLLPHLEWVSLPLHQVIYEANNAIQYVYFPIGAMISLVSTLLNGSTIEVGIIGHKGMAGISVILSGTTGTHRALVQVAGDALRLEATVLQAEFGEGGSLQKILLRYVQALLVQTSQSVACNRFHTTEKRLARWLLLVADAVSKEEFLLTQEFIGQMLGVRRAGVTVAAGNLAQLGLIRYTRGKIEVVSRHGLEDFSCECYGVIRNEFSRMLRL
ncbi:Crp/Fnr family transcriptional regulator [Phormidium sp. CLA17]|uniref:Crp/Fnr family transcriptional regulator n=1 Tax=Leptolyngbya sp. Cla-17 TaxID=2803751 RepID=UPI001493149D|nr:Crp/Fnr family transcriptional regulator [Leptolyngbya sp. Cla-17]MBM0740267.1 Crp/Fnr family transcriptional regulator [Leptolyngbya sp. Cla-17]MBM0745492.1 Crp/Fnr family transcriptional regulator [Leptolyngbya sp. Cla-17]